MLFTRDGLTTAAVDYSGGSAYGVKYAGGMRSAERFGEVRFVEDCGLLGAA